MGRFLIPLVLLAHAVSAIARDPLPKAADGFQVELVLQAPDIEAPTALAVAANGDVYFAEDPMDMGGPPTKNIDKIWLLKGGDAKTKVLFAEQMWAVMGLEVVRDKLYCVHPPYVTVFTLDADGKAAKREDLFTDLGPPVAGAPSFNDHVPSGIRMGMDGWLYVSIGDKGIPKMTRKEKHLGSVHVAEGRWRHTKEGNHISLEGGGVIRFRPDGTGLEVFASGTRNHLDVPLDEHDRIFVRDNTDDGLGWWTRLMYLPQGGFLGYPWAHKEKPKECLPAITDFQGGSPCGGYVYTDDGLPETYRGRVFHCEWGQGKVSAVKIGPDGAGFKFIDQIDFLTPNGVKDFRPFTLRPSADGRGFYVTDWGHSGWLAKVKAGRLWKVTYTKDDVKPAARGKDSDSIEQLVKSLDHPTHTERLRAQRELISRGEKAVQAIVAQKMNLTPRATRHALWVVGKVGGLNWMMGLPLESMKHDEAEVRLEAVRVLGTCPWRSSKEPGDGNATALGNWVTLTHKLFDLMEGDPSASVRLQAVLALKVNNGKRFVLALDKEQDPAVRLAIIHALRERCHWDDLEAQFAKDDYLKDKPRALDGVMTALSQVYDEPGVLILTRWLSHTDAAVRRATVETLGRVYFDRKPYAGTWWGTQPAGQNPPSRTIAWAGTPLVREAILKALADKDAGVRKAAVAALVASLDAATFEPLVKQFAAEKDPEAMADIIRAISGLRKGDTTFLISVLQDRTNTESVRREAIAGLELVVTTGTREALAKIALAAEPGPLRVRAVEALAIVKGKEALEACAKVLKGDETDNLRRAAATTLGQLGEPSAAELLVPLLGEKEEVTVKTAAMQALGALKAKSAVAALVAAASVEATQFDAVTALTQMPDIRAVSAYLTGLRSKNATLRQASALAIAAIRDEAAPVLKQLVERGEVPTDLLPPLRTIYQSYQPILSWHLIGPFPRGGKAHPPEKEQSFDAKYPGAGKEVAWKKDQKGDTKNHGKVNLASLISPDGDIEAYGYTEIDSDFDRDAQLLIGSDDTMTIWLNGQKVFDFQGDRGWAHNQDKANVKLKKGKNALLIKCGNAGGPWEYSVAVSADDTKYAFLQGGDKKFDLNAFRDFARKNKGDAERGQKLFADLKGLACVKCHTVGGQGGLVGPTLDGIALRYQKEDLMTNILEPSKVISNGYDTVVIMTTAGKQITGVFKGETGDAVNLMDAEGKAVSVPKKDIDERQNSPVSTMPNGLNEGMTLQDFADVIAFLEARRETTPPPKK